MVKSAGSRSTKIGVEKGGTRRILDFTTAQNNPRSYTALVRIVDDDEAVVELAAAKFGNSWL
jgi:hypothetical protein